MQSNVKQPQRRIIRSILQSIAIFVLVLVIFVGVNVVRTLLIAAGIVHFWQEKANEPVASNALRLVALGDSATQAIGADNPMEGFVCAYAFRCSTPICSNSRNCSVSICRLAPGMSRCNSPKRLVPLSK